MMAGMHKQTETPKLQDRNSSAYNEALMRRGSLTVLFDPEINRVSGLTSTRGRQRTCSDATIQTCVLIEVLFGMAIRQTTGFVERMLRRSTSTGQCPSSAC